MVVYDPDRAEVVLPPLPAQPAGVPWPTASWPRGPAGEGTDRRRLADLLDEAFAEPAPVDRLGLTLATVIVHRGRVVEERYGPTVGPDTALISWSMAKSITHAAVGILVRDGRLDPHAPAAVPEWQEPDDPRASITLDHLLRMVPGLEFNEDYVDDATSHCLEMLWGDDGHRDMAHYAARQRLLHPPGQVFNYSSGTTNIIARLVGDIVGRGADGEAWLRRELFDPIGMTSAEPRFDLAGTFVGSSYVFATAVDFARFGLLYLRDGTWDGTRILPPGWVDRARTPQAEDPESGPYGAHWWVPAPGRFAARGYEGQRIIVVPELDLIVVRLGKTPIELAPALDGWADAVIDCFAP